jgi:uncharacterized membrane protein YidH (DUF202 family)
MAGMPDVAQFLILLSGTFLALVVFSWVVTVANYRGQFTLRSMWLFVTILCVLIGLASVLARALGR